MYACAEKTDLRDDMLGPLHQITIRSLSWILNVVLFIHICSLGPCEHKIQVNEEWLRTEKAALLLLTYVFGHVQHTVYPIYTERKDHHQSGTTNSSYFFIIHSDRLCPFQQKKTVCKSYF